MDINRAHEQLVISIIVFKGYLRVRGMIET